MFLREYLRMLLALGAAMALYGISVRPVVDWRSDEAKRLTENFVQHTQGRSGFEHLFPEGAWQADAPLRLQTRRGETLLFGGFENVGPRRYRLKPLTIVIPQKVRDDGAGGATGSYLVLENPDGAELQSNDDIDWMSGSTPRIANFYLNGPVRIRSIETGGASGPRDDFAVDTSHIKIEGQRIWSAQDVSIRLGESIIEGRDFALTLKHRLFESGGSTPGPPEPFADLERLELIYVHRVRVALRPGGLISDETAGGAAGGAAARLELRCKRSFELDFPRLLAKLHEQVVMEHIVEGRPVDSFAANRIDLQFEAVDPASPPPASPLTPSPLEVDEHSIRLARFEAFGSSSPDQSDPSRWIKVDAPNFAAGIQTRWLHYRVSDAAIVLANRLPGDADYETSPIFLHREGVRIWSPKLEYKYLPPPPAGSDPRHLGLFWADGPGAATMTGESGEEWHLNWAKTLTLRPDGGEDLLSIDGSAQIRSDRQGKYSADQIQLWVSQEGTSNVPEPSEDSLAHNVLPQRLKAVGNVSVASAPLRAQVANLGLWFHHLPLDPPPAALASALISQPLAVPATDPGPVAVPVSLSRNDGLLQPAAGDPAAARVLPAGPPMTITGSSMQAKLACRSGADPVLEHLQLEGDIAMTRERLSEDHPLPVTVMGDRLQLQSQGREVYLVEIHGTPARIDVGSGMIIGPSIVYDQHRQLLRMDEPGELQLPAEMLVAKPPEPPPASAASAPTLLQPGGPPQGDGPDAEGRWVEPPVIGWKGLMSFDGMLMTMKGGVAIRAKYATDPTTLWHIQTESDELRVELTGSAFAKPGGEPVAVRAAQLYGDADIRAVQIDAGGGWRSLEHLQLPQLTVFPQQQTILGGGPGSYRSRRFHRGAAASAAAQAAAPPQPAGMLPVLTGPLQCIHLTYRGELDGSYAENRLTVRGDVAAAMSEIQNWEDSIDVDRLETLRPGQTKLECETLSMFSKRSLPSVQQALRDFPELAKSAWEVVAKDNVLVDSYTERGLVQATAGDARYDAMYGQLKLAASPTRPVTIDRPPSPEDPNGDHAEFREVWVDLRTGQSTLTMLGATGSLPNAYQIDPARPGAAPVPTATAPAALPATNLLRSPRDTDIFKPAR